MNTLVEIKTAIARLSDDETSALLSWLQERSEDDWDKQIKKDSEQGKLNAQSRVCSKLKLLSPQYFVP